jgi:ABC-type multidrug transport system ATPase subunit
MGYVEQFDIMSPAQTVVEALQFSARLRLPPSVSNHQVRCACWAACCRQHFKRLTMQP